MFNSAEGDAVLNNRAAPVGSSDQLLEQATGLFQSGRTQEAETLCYELLRAQPDHVAALEVAALCAARLDRRPEAVALLERAVELDPGRAQCHYNLGVTYQELGLKDEAILVYRNCLRLAPKHGDALWNLGDLYRLNEHFVEAIDCFERLLALGRDHPDLHHRYGVALHGLGDDQGAAAQFEQARAGTTSEPALTRWEYGHVLLTRGEFEKGWDCYDQRFAARSTGVVCHPYDYPPWRGEPLADQTLLIHGEQGLGDEIMFASMLPELLGEAGRVVLACQPPLVRLFTGSFPAVSVRAHSTASGSPADVSDLQPIDYQVPIGSLAGLRRRSREAFVQPEAYLVADKDRAAQFAARLAQLAPSAVRKFKVGLMWSANPAHGVEWGRRRARHKSIPLALFQPLSSLRERVAFVSVQNRDSGAQAAHAPWLDLVDFQRELLDLADTAALIDNLDLVITVDTSIAHLAGALGKPVWILLMQRADFRWLRDTDKSIWYPSARLFRQQQQGEWEPVIDNVVTELRQLVGPA